MYAVQTKGRNEFSSIEYTAGIHAQTGCKDLRLKHEVSLRLIYATKKPLYQTTVSFLRANQTLQENIIFSLFLHS